MFPARPVRPTVGPGRTRGRVLIVVNRLVAPEPAEHGCLSFFLDQATRARRAGAPDRVAGDRLLHQYLPGCRPRGRGTCWCGITRFVDAAALEEHQRLLRVSAVARPRSPTQSPAVVCGWRRRPVRGSVSRSRTARDISLTPLDRDISSDVSATKGAPSCVRKRWPPAAAHPDGPGHEPATGGHEGTEGHDHPHGPGGISAVTTWSTVSTGSTVTPEHGGHEGRGPRGGRRRPRLRKPRRLEGRGGFDGHGGGAGRSAATSGATLILLAEQPMHATSDAGDG